MDKYAVVSIVGEGSFGKVYKATDKSTNETVALKVIGKRGRATKELKGLRQEYEIQRKLRHPNIIQTIESFETDNEIVVVTEFAKGDLHRLLAREGSMNEERAQKLTFDLVSALYYLHSHRTLHRDLKPQNILLDDRSNAKLCDFGLARNMTMGTHVLTSIKGTPLYMAPELMAEKPYDHGADLWSLGCIIYEVLAGQPPFCTTSILQLVHLIQHEHVKWPSFLTSNCISFLQGLLEKDPNLRMTWPQILDHPFVKGHITILNEDIDESPFTASMTDSQSREKKKQTNKIMYGHRSPTKPSDIQQGNDENLTSSRDSMAAVLQSDLEGLETDTDESLGGERKNTIVAINLREVGERTPIVFVPGNSNLIVNRFNDNFPPNASSVNWHLNLIYPNFLNELHMMPANQNLQHQPVQQSIEVPTTDRPTGAKRKVKTSELEKRKLSQNLDNFSVRLGQSQDLNTIAGVAGLRKDDGTGTGNVLKPPDLLKIVSPNMLPGWDSCDESQSTPIENEEWIAFLQRSMEEILDGELESLKQQNLVSIIVSPLRNAKASCKVIEKVAQLLSLPLLLCGSTILIADIQKVYVEVKLVPNLVYASKLLCSKSSMKSPSTPLPTSPDYNIEPISGLTHEELKTLSALYELVCHLVHLDTQFLSQFCDAIAILGADKLIINYLRSESYDNPILIRLANNVLALLSCAIRELPENAELVEKIVFSGDVDLVRLLKHDNNLTRTRTTILLGLLGRYSCRALQSNWNSSMRDALEILLADENDQVKNEAESVLEEFKHLSFYTQDEQVV